MGVPKKRTSKMRRNRRRAANSNYVAPNVIKCARCKEPALPHTVCPSCGFYKGREVVAVEG